MSDPVVKSVFAIQVVGLLIQVYEGVTLVRQIVPFQLLPSAQVAVTDISFAILVPPLRIGYTIFAVLVILGFTVIT